MLFINKLFWITMSSLIILTIVTTASCSIKEYTDRTTTTYKGPAIDYSTYEIKASDIRFECFQHPLYRFEYPSIFQLIDWNLADIPHISCNETKVQFTVPTIDIPKPKLSIIVEKQGYRDYNNAAGKLEFWQDYMRDFTNNITTKKTEVYGIPSYYLEAHFIQEKGILYSDYRVLSRSVYFDYADLIWEIHLNWVYQDSIGPEVEEYFNHVIQTFEILD